MEIKIVELTKELANHYVLINVLAWQETYTGIIDSKFLNLISNSKKIQETVEHTIQSLSKSNVKKYLLQLDGKYVGILSLDYSQVPDSGELKALYVLKEAQKKGLGTVLFQKAVTEFTDKGISKMVIGCLKANPSNSFYVHMGCRLIGERFFTIGEQKLSENVYELSDLSLLLKS